MLAVTALLCALCGSHSSNQATVTVTPSSAQPSKESGLQEYQSAQQLADDLTRHGHPCNMIPQGGSFYAVDGGKCYIDGKETLLGIYASQSQIDQQLGINELLAKAGLDYGWLTGKNWAINCGSRDACEKIAADLGGSITAPIFPPTGR
jgi:hypothetical protein